MTVRIWQGTRVALAVGLVALFLMGPPDRGAVRAPVLVTSSTSVADLAEALATATPPDIIFADSLPPSRNASTLMAGAASGGAGVTLLMPGTVPALSATAPSAPVAGRRSSLTVTLRGGPGAVVPVVVDDPSGAADTVAVVIGPPGVETISIAVEPTRAGANTWVVHAAGESTVVHAWARPEEAVRILVLSGPPGWESRYLIRALEASGAHVSVRQDLGRGNEIVTTGAAIPTNLPDLEAFDVVAVFGPLELEEDLMATWVRDSGGGMLIIGPTSWRRTLGSWSTSTAPSPRIASAIRWDGPAEIVPLPSVELTVEASTLPAPFWGVPVAWSGTDPDEPDETYAAAGWMGRGRVFASGILTWPWVMEAGLGAEHAEYWESVVEWLAGGLRDETSVVGDVCQPFVAWKGRLAGAPSASFELLRAPGPSAISASAPETLRPVRTPEGDDYVRFVPLAPGDHPLGTDLRIGAVVTVAENRPSWVSVALQVGGEGGILRSLARGDSQASGLPVGHSSQRPMFAFLLLAAFAVAGWATRRLQGRR